MEPPCRIAPADRLPQYALASLLFASLALNTIGIDWGMPNTNAWHGDDMCHYTLRAIGDGFSSFTKYPIVHHLTLAAVFAPYLAWTYVTGQLDPSAGGIEVFQDPVRSLTVLIVIGRCVGVLMATATVWVLYRIVLRLTNHWPAALIGAGAYALSNTVVLFAKLTSVDTPMMFWFALVFHAYLRFAETFRPRTGLWFGVLISVSVSTKEQIGGAYVLMVATLLVLFVRRRSRARASREAPPSPRGIWSGAIGITVTYAVLSKLVIDPAGWAQRLDYWLKEGTDPAVWGGFPNTLPGHAQLAGATVQTLADAAGLPLVVLAAVAAAAALLHGGVHSWRVFVPMLSYYVFTLSMIRYVNTRFMLPLLFLGSVLLGLGLYRLGHRRGKVSTLCFACAALVLLWSAARCWRVDALMSRDTRYRAETLLGENLPRSAQVEVYAGDHYLPRLERLGLVRRHLTREKMRADLFRLRKPAAVVLAPARWWQLDAGERRFLDWLVDGSGYEKRVVERDPASSFLAPGEADALQSVLIVLLRPR